MKHTELAKDKNKSKIVVNNLIKSSLKQQQQRVQPIETAKECERERQNAPCVQERQKILQASRKALCNAEQRTERRKSCEASRVCACEREYECQCLVLSHTTHAHTHTHTHTSVQGTHTAALCCNRNAISAASKSSSSLTKKSNTDTSTQTQICTQPRTETQRHTHTHGGRRTQTQCKYAIICALSEALEMQSNDVSFPSKRERERESAR